MKCLWGGDGAQRRKTLDRLRYSAAKEDVSKRNHNGFHGLNRLLKFLIISMT